MSDEGVRPPIIAIARRALSPHVCPVCNRAEVAAQRVPMTVAEVTRDLTELGRVYGNRHLKLDLGPGGFAYVYGVHYGDGGHDGYWVALELGRVIGRNVDE